MTESNTSSSFGQHRTGKEQRELYKEWKGGSVETPHILTPREKARRVLENVRKKKRRI